ncbi:hypothetical protein G9A89_023252 [Geosiphon pyriformis]|nr:hypothetical protein G9A89_023252 [Geosiphon pyriformis]
MFTKKSARDATTSSVSRSLRQKPKVLLSKNMDTSSDKKLEYEMGKNLDSCTNTPKVKCFNSNIVVAPFLSLCDFCSAIDNINMGLSPSVFLESLYHSVVSVKEKLCFELTKFFAFDIGLSAIPGNSLHNKLKSVRALFYKIDDFGSVSTPSKFPGIVRASFISDSSLTLAKQLAVSENFEIVIKEILVDLPKLAIESALVKYGKIFSIKMQLIGLWQKALVEFKSSQVADLVVSKWSILLGKDSVHIAKANSNKQITTVHNLSNLVQLYAHCAVICFDSNDAKEAAIYSMLVFRGINLVWTGLFSSKYTAYGNFGHGFMRKRFLCFDSDKRCLVLIYAKKQTPVSHLIFFSDTTWTFVVSSFPKNLYSTLLTGNNLGISSVASLMPVVMFLASCVTDILHKLDRLLAVSLANSTVPPTSKHNSVLDIAVDTPLFIFPMPGVVTAVSQNIFPNGTCVLTAKIGGLEANLTKIATYNIRDINIPAKQNDIIRWHMVSNNDISIIVNKLSGVRVFTSGLDAGFLGMSVTLIINENLAKHVSKISEILDRLLMICLLFKNKQSVFVLGLYMKASLDKCVIQAGLVNFFIVRACNKSTFVILGSDFNKDENKCSSSFSKCMGLGLVNTLVNSSYIKASTWKNFRGVERVLDYIFVFQSLSNALVNGCVVDVDEFFGTDYSSVQITIGLANKNKWKFNVKNANKVKWEQYKIASHNNFAMFSDKFTDCCCSSDLDGMWGAIHKVIYFSANEVFSKTWSKNFDGGFTKCFSYYHRLKLLVSKLVKASYSVSSIGFIFLLNPFCKITLNYLVVDRDLILEPGLVKFHVNRIMKSLTRKHVVVNNVSDKWYCQLQLLKYVFDDAFLNIMHPIEVEEFLGVVLSLPNNKAAGLSSTTTQSPIFAIGSVVEDALEKNCELWLVLQDIRKAYNLTFEQIQAKDKVAAVVCFANSGGVLGQLFKHKLHDLQVLICISVNSLNNFLAGVVWVFFGSGLFLGNLMYVFLLFVVMELLLLSSFGKTFKWWKRLDSCGPVPVWFAAAVQYLHNFGSLDVCSLPPDDDAAKNILNSYKFRTVCDRLSGVSASGFSVYMDGFLCGLESVNIKAGTVAFFEDFNLEIGVEVTGMISSTLAKLQAIALTLKCVPNLSSVHLFSDSQAALDVYKAELLLLAPDFHNKYWVKCQHITGVLDNVQTNLLAGVSFCSGWFFSFQLKECFVLAKDSIVSGNFRHFVHNVFQSIHRACWELGSDTKIVNSHLLTNVDWSKLSLVSHPDSHIAAGFMIKQASTTSKKRDQKPLVTFGALPWKQHSKNKFKVTTTPDATTLEYYQSIYIHCKQRFNIPDGIEVVKKSVYQYIENCINNYLFGNYNISEVRSNLYNNLAHYSQLKTENLNSETLATYFQELNFNIIKYCEETYPVQSQYSIDFESETETSNKDKQKLKQYSKTTPNTPILPKTTAKHLQTPEQGTTENQSKHSETAANEENNSEITEEESINSENEENEMTAYIAKIPEFNGEDIETSPQEWLDQVTKAGNANRWNAARIYEMAMKEANHTKLVNLAIGETSSAAEEKIDQLTKKIENYFTNQQQQQLQRYQSPQR